jgi:antitoxin (DNA-binding transcriptional repressor) of toxin-antitoxin stability system
VVQVNIGEAKRRLEELVDRAASGEEIIIARRGKPVARLVRPDPDSGPDDNGDRSKA